MQTSTTFHQMSSGQTTKTFTTFFQKGSGWKTRTFEQWKGGEFEESFSSDTSWFSTETECERDMQRRMQDHKEMGWS